jgi:hypothetical protein
MANQAIALQARAPQTDFLGRAVQQNAQMMNMMSQQRAAERQAAQAQQAMELARAEEGRKAQLHGPAMEKALSEATAAGIKTALDFSNFVYTGLSNAADPAQAMQIAQRIGQQPQFQDGLFQGALADAMSTMPQDPAEFAVWKEDTLIKTVEAAKRAQRKLIEQTSGDEQRILSVPEYGRGAATEVPGSRIAAPPGITYVKGPNSEIIPMPKTVPGGGFDTPAPSAPTGAGGDTFSRMINVESRGQQFDRSGKPLTSRAGAIGIAQVMPGTAPEAARLAGLPFDENRYRNDPEYNLALGKAYYEKQLADFGDERLAAAAYNAGPGAVRRALQKGGPNGWINHVPRETQDYLRDVFGAAPAGRGSAGGPDIRFGEAIPGTGKGEKVAAEAYNAMEGTVAKYDKTIALAERLLNNTALDGIIGNVQGNIPETVLGLSSQAAANALSDYNALLSVAGFQELQAMRDASPTGGALGQVSDSENKLLQQSAFASSRTQDETKFRESLREYIRLLRGSKKRVEGAYERTYGGRFVPTRGGSSQPPAAAPARGGVDMNNPLLRGM